MTQVSVDGSRIAERQSARQSQPAVATNGDLPLEFAALLAASNTREEMYQQLVLWLQNRGITAATGFYLQQADCLESGPNNFDGPAFENELFLASAKSLAEVSRQSGSIHCCNVERIRNLKLVSVPIPTGERQFDALTAAMVIPVDGQQDSSLLMTVAAHAALWHANRKQATTRQQLELTAAALGMLTAIQSADSLQASCVTLVNLLKRHLNCRAVVLGMSRKSGGKCRISAMSGLAEFDSNAAFVASAEDALEECIVRDRLTQFPATDSTNRDSLLSHQKLANELQAEQLLSHPLKNDHGEPVGAWMVVGDSTLSKSSEAELLLRTAASPVANSLIAAQQNERAFFANRKSGQRSARVLLRALGAVVVISAILLVPVPYRIHCKSAAEPDVRRFVVAPHEGLVEKTFVEPGDVVQQGQLLARMDGRDVRWELAGLAAEQEQARKDHDSGLLSGDVAEAQRATLELRRLESRKEILTRRCDELELKSPISGIVLDGHLDRVENAPVTIGQAMYEVAPLSPVTVEVAIPDDEHPHVQVGFDVVVRFDGIDTEYTGTIQRIQPRSEVRDGDNVFIAEVAIENDDHQLRPGMSGYSRIRGTSHSLGWNLFHRPWEHLRKLSPF